jgi:hypothetical protein
VPFVQCGERLRDQVLVLAGERVEPGSDRRFDPAVETLRKRARRELLLGSRGLKSPDVLLALPGGERQQRLVHRGGDQPAHRLVEKLRRLLGGA